MKISNCYFLVLYFILSITACSKKPDVLPPFSYAVTSIDNVVVPQYADTLVSIPVNISHDKGVAEEVTVSANSTTQGITISSVSYKRLPPYTATVTLRVCKQIPGSYPVTITTSSSSTVDKSFTATISVSSNSTCAQALTGIYVSYLNATNYPQYEQRITASGTNTILLPLNKFDALIATVDCSTGALTTASLNATVGSISSGSGTFTADSIVVTYLQKTPIYDQYGSSYTSRNTITYIR